MRDADTAERVVADCVAAEVDAAAHKLEHKEAVRVADKADFDFWVAAEVVTINDLCTVRVHICLVALFTLHSFASGKTLRMPCSSLIIAPRIGRLMPPTAFAY